MPQTLRQRQAALTRTTILEVLVEHISESGSLDFTIADMADRAGVSHRTVYNYFGDRQGLLDAFSAYADELLGAQGATDIPGTLEALPGVVAANFSAMSATAPLCEAYARLDVVRSPLPGRLQRTNETRERVASAFPALSSRETIAVAAVVRQLISSKQWYHLTREHALSTDEASGIVAWLLRQIIEALKSGDRPLEGGK
jgi:TetR/AcrR family transcriptional repressor of bet genes